MSFRDIDIDIDIDSTMSFRQQKCLLWIPENLVENCFLLTASSPLFRILNAFLNLRSARTPLRTRPRDILTSCGPGCHISLRRAVEIKNARTDRSPRVVKGERH